MPHDRLTSAWTRIAASPAPASAPVSGFVPCPPALLQYLNLASAGVPSVYQVAFERAREAVAQAEARSARRWEPSWN